MHLWCSVLKFDAVMIHKCIFLSSDDSLSPDFNSCKNRVRPICIVVFICFCFSLCLGSWEVWIPHKWFMGYDCSSLAKAEVYNDTTG